MDLGTRNPIYLIKEFRSQLGHHDDRLAARRYHVNQSLGQPFWLCHHRVEGSDNRLSAIMQKVHYISSPRTGKEAKLVLQTYNITGTVVGHFRRKLVSVPTAIFNDMYDAGIVIA
jgi:hypothetical protein